MSDIQIIVDWYLKRSESASYNPKPLFAYLCNAWFATTTETVFYDYLRNSDAKVPFAEINLFLQNDPEFIFGKNVNKHIQVITRSCRQMITSLSSRTLLGLQYQTDKTLQLLIHFIELFKVLKHYLATCTEIPIFTNNYVHARILPGGHCFVISEEVKDLSTPDPFVARTSQHVIRYHDGVYYSEVNTNTQPSAEKMGQYLVSKMDPKVRSLYAHKSPSILLSRDKKTGQFTTKLLHLSLEVKGVTLESVILARDAFKILCPSSTRKIPHAIVDKLLAIHKNPPHEAELTEKALQDNLPAQYRDNRACNTVINKLLCQHCKPTELHMAVRVLNKLVDRPQDNKLKDWFLKVIPYINALFELIQKYGSTRSNHEFREFLENSLSKINPEVIHLLGLSCSMLLDHDAVGTNILYDLESGDFRYIDADYRLKHPAIAQKKCSTARKVSSDSSTSNSPSSTSKFYPQINSILTVLNQFHKVPLSERMIKRMRKLTAEELLFGCLHAARQYEQMYKGLLIVFPISEFERTQLEVPLLLSTELLEQGFKIFQAVIAAFQGDECRYAIDVLRKALPNTAKVACHAYLKTHLLHPDSDGLDASVSVLGNTGDLDDDDNRTMQPLLSTWRDNFFTHCPDLHTMFPGDPVIECAHEFGYDAVEELLYESLNAVPRHKKSLTQLLQLFSLEWIDYKTIPDALHARLCERFQKTLVMSGIITDIEFKSIQTRSTLVRHGSATSTNETHSPSSEKIESPSSSRQTTPRSEFFGSLFRRQNRLNGSAELRLNKTAEAPSSLSLRDLSGTTSEREDQRLSPTPSLDDIGSSSSVSSAVALRSSARERRGGFFRRSPFNTSGEFQIESAPEIQRSVSQKTLSTSGPIEHLVNGF